MKFLITDSREQKLSNLNKIEAYEVNGFLNVFSSIPTLDWMREGCRFILMGSIIGVRSTKGSIDTSISKESLKVMLEDSVNINLVEGRYALIKITTDKKLQIWADYFGRLDIFVQHYNNNFYISSGLDLLPVSKGKESEIDDVGMMQAMYIYGGRPAKKHTVYKNVYRLGVSEILSFDNISGFSSTVNKRHFKSKREYSEPSGLHDYSDIFIDSVKARSSTEGNIVLLSSGWDSTSILATLVHLHGNQKVRAVIGRMKYSDRSGIANSFEMERASKIADYFGVDLDIVDLDYRSGSDLILEELDQTYRPQQFTNITGFNHWLLAENAAKKTDSGERVFAGEMSDGAHNFGFSQYATIFHPSSYDYREYSDKMASYLFGPTFLDVLINGEQDKDPVWNHMYSLKGESFFESLAKDEYSIKLQFLKSFFLRSGRVPLAKNTSNLMTEEGKASFDAVTSEIYLSDYARVLESENLYAIYLDLYNSFHWQGSTVATLYHACEAHDLECMMPFHDTELIDYLSYMPENWGRGLEMKPTKYPLKWMLSNKIDYPMDMQSGPHSYTYDVDPTFTHTGELINHSSLGDLFKSQLKTSNYLDLFSPDSFNCSYIKDLVGRYTKGEEILGPEQGDIINVSMQTILGPKKN